MFFWEPTRGPAEDMAAVAESANKDVHGWSLSWSRCVPSEDQFCGFRNERVWIAMKEGALLSVCRLKNDVYSLQCPEVLYHMECERKGGWSCQRVMAHVEMENSFEFRPILSLFSVSRGRTPSGARDLLMKMWWQREGLKVVKLIWSLLKKILNVFFYRNLLFTCKIYFILKCF